MGVLIAVGAEVIVAALEAEHRERLSDVPGSGPANAGDDAARSAVAADSDTLGRDPGPVRLRDERGLVGRMDVAEARLHAASIARV